MCKTKYCLQRPTPSPALSHLERVPQIAQGKPRSRWARQGQLRLVVVRCYCAIVAAASAKECVFGACVRIQRLKTLSRATVSAILAYLCDKLHRCWPSHLYAAAMVLALSAFVEDLQVASDRRCDPVVRQGERYDKFSTDSSGPRNAEVLEFQFDSVLRHASGSPRIDPPRRSSVLRGHHGLPRVLAAFTAAELTVATRAHTAWQLDGGGFGFVRVFGKPKASDRISSLCWAVSRPKSCHVHS